VSSKKRTAVSFVFISLLARHFYYIVIPKSKQTENLSRRQKHVEGEKPNRLLLFDEFELRRIIDNMATDMWAAMDLCVMARTDAQEAGWGTPVCNKLLHAVTLLPRQPGPMA
jgi:hypothetical protein